MKFTKVLMLPLLSSILLCSELYATAETTSWLVVSKITAKNICVVAKVRSQGDDSKNRIARDIAEQSGGMSCLK